jgi:DNA-binding NarL/FixJ family response regulator
MENEKKILIVEDDQDFAEMTKECLKVKGYKIDVVTSREDALQFFKKEIHHIALIDIFLGKENGFELINSFKELHPKIVCVMMTAYPKKEFAISSLEKGVYDILFKPFDPLELLSVIKRCVEKIHLENANEQLEKGLNNSNLFNDLKEFLQLEDLTEINDETQRSVALKQIGDLLNRDKTRRKDLYLNKLGLTNREKEIVLLIHEGGHPTDIAQKLFISKFTVKNHLQAIYKKLNVSSRLEIVKLLENV